MSDAIDVIAVQAETTNNKTRKNSRRSEAAQANRTEAFVEDIAAEDATRQFVTFQVQDETFAVPLNKVQEIIRLPAMVQVPKALPSLEGLANLRGNVLPIMSLRCIFNMPKAAHDEATRVVVINDGKAIGFVVDNMSRVETAEPQDIEPISSIAATIDAQLLEGIIKRNHAMIMILNAARLTSQTNMSGQAPRLSQANIGNDLHDTHTETVSDEIQLVSFELDGQEYALPIENVQEIVQIPDIINAIPNAPPHLVGVVNLRNRLLPLISLRTMFGMAQVGLSEQSRVVVVTQDFDGETHYVGLLTDKVREVLRVAKSLVDPLPNILSSGGGRKEITQICRLEAGKRLVSILLPERLFVADDFLKAHKLSHAAEVQTNDKEITDMMSAGVDEEDQFVIFRVAAEEYGVPINSIQEIVRIPDQLTRVPKAPDFIEGVVNLRGLVLPVIDQRKRFGLANIERNDRQRIMVFMVQRLRVGFIVDSVSEVLKISQTQISPTPMISGQEGSIVSKVANIVGVQRMILMLDVEHLLSDAETQSLNTVAA